MTQEQQAPKTMRLRVNASRTLKGYSVDATAEITDSADTDIDSWWTGVGQYLEAIALDRLESLMAKLNAQYPREG